MSGFRRPDRIIVVEFGEDTDWHGAEVRCRRGVSVDRVLEFEALTTGAMADIAQAIRGFGDDVIVGWNLEDDDGQPVPATGAELLKWPVDFGLALVTGWLRGALQVDAPLVGASSNGALSEPELSEAMAVL